MRIHPFRTSPLRWPIAGAIAWCALVAFLDASVGEGFSLRLLLLPAVMLVAARSGALAGTVLSAAVILAWLFTAPSFSPPLFWEAATRLALFAAICLLASRLAQSLRREVQLARTDPLTGLLNVRGFHERLESEINRSRRSGRPLTLAILDCDRFKQLNDTLGHAAGDETLRLIASVLRDQTRSYDAAARPGGDEFALLLPETSAEAARSVMVRLQAALTAAMADRGLPVTFSIGVVTFEQPPDDPADLLRAADARMYDVKRAGGNAVG